MATGLRSVARALTQALNLTSLVDRVRSVPRIISQTISTNTVIARLSSFFRILTQTTSITNRVVETTISIYNRLVSVALNMSQIVSRLSFISRLISQSLNLGNIATSLRSVAQALSQSLSMTGFVTRLTSISRTISQSLLATPSSIGERVTELFGRIASIAITISDIARRLLYASRTVTGSFAISDVVTRLTEISRAISQSLNISGFATRVTFQIYERIVSVYFAITQLVQRSRMIPTVITQTINLNVIASRLARMYRSVFESLLFILRLLFPCGFYTTQESCESEGCNWCDNACQVISCSVATTTVPTGTGGGGGGGMRLPWAAKISDFTVDKDLIKGITFTPGETDIKLLEISNTGETELTMTARIENLGRFLVFPGGLSEFTFELSPDETKTLQLNFFALEDQEPGIYPGKIVITSDTTEEIVTVVVEVESKKPVFDIKVEIPSSYKEIYLGEEVVAQLTLYNLERVGLVDVDLEYGIKDTLNNVIISDYETLAVETQISIIRRFYIPSDVEPGYYVFFAKVSYDDVIGVGSETFRVKKIGIEMETIVIISVVSASTLTAIVAIILYKRSVRRRRYTETIEGIKKYMKRKK